MKRCRVVVAGEACGKPAQVEVTFGDGDVVQACYGCAKSLREIAQTHGTNITVAKLPDAPPSTDPSGR